MTARGILCSSNELYCAFQCVWRVEREFPRTSTHLEDQSTVAEGNWACSRYAIAGQSSLWLTTLETRHHRSVVSVTDHTRYMPSQVSCISWRSASILQRFQDIARSLEILTVTAKNRLNSRVFSVSEGIRCVIGGVWQLIGWFDCFFTVSFFSLIAVLL